MMWPLMTGKLQGSTGLIEEMAEVQLTFGGEKKENEKPHMA